MDYRRISRLSASPKSGRDLDGRKEHCRYTHRSRRNRRVKSSRCNSPFRFRRAEGLPLMKFDSERSFSRMTASNGDKAMKVLRLPILLVALFVVSSCVTSSSPPRCCEAAYPPPWFDLDLITWGRAVVGKGQPEQLKSFDDNFRQIIGFTDLEAHQIGCIHGCDQLGTINRQPNSSTSSLASFQAFSPRSAKRGARLRHPGPLQRSPSRSMPTCLNAIAPTHRTRLPVRS